MAARNKHLEACRYLLGQGAAVNAQRSHDSKTTLHVAVSNDDAEVAHLLVSNYGALTNLRDSSRHTPVSLAFKKDYQKVISIFTAETRTHHICHGFVCQAIRFALPGKHIFLWEAIRNNDTETAKFIINNGCIDPNFESGRVSSVLPFHLAAWRNNSEVAEELLRIGQVDVNRVDCKGGVNEPDKRGCLPLHHAASSVTAYTISLLLHETRSIDSRDAEVYTPFHRAVMPDRMHGVKAFLEFGPVNLQNTTSDGMTTPMSAAPHERLWKDLASAGLSLPWNLIVLESSERVVMILPGSTPSKPRHQTIPRQVILTGLRVGQFKFVDIVRANFSLASAMLRRGELSSRDLDFTGEEEILMQIYKQRALPVLKDILELGFDGSRAILGASHSGIAGLVEMLLETDLRQTARDARDETGATAYDIANREGHFDVAESLWKAGFGSVQGHRLLDDFPIEVVEDEIIGQEY